MNTNDDTQVAPFSPAVIEKLVENGKKVYGWRYIGDVPALCIVEVHFTVVPDSAHEPKPEFERKMLVFAAKLSASGYPVADYSIDQRAGGRPWASFHCRTPQWHLRRPRD